MNKLFTDVFATLSFGTKKETQKYIYRERKPQKPGEDVAKIHNKLHFMALCQSYVHWNPNYSRGKFLICLFK